ncbi:MAG: sodium/proline symporter, partial [Sedimentibacter sp.]
MNTSMIIIIVIYLAICLAIGAYSSKLQTNAGEFYTSGNRLGPWVSGLAVSSTIMSGYGWVGSIGSMYKSGYAIFWLTIPAAWGVLFSYIVLGRPLRSISEKFGALTIPEIVRVRYNSDAVHLLTTIAIIVGLVGYNMTNLKALGSLGEVIFGVDYMFALTVGTILIGIYIFLGGMLSAALTAAFQSFIMCVAAVVAVVMAYKFAGGFTVANLTLSATDPSLVQMVHKNGTYN